MNRREFIKDIVIAGAGAMLGKEALSASPLPPLSRRPYGRTGVDLSVIGLGGIVVMNTEQEQANDIVAWAVDRGVNYFDVAPTYGNAQDRLGPALKPYRDQSFLACKTGQREAAGARAELENSLQVLQTDHVDLYQLHGLTKVEEVEQVFAPGGAMETFMKAREEGKVRWLGFSAHHVESALLAMSKFDFDSVLFPFNAVCLERGDFGRQVLDEAERRHVARLGLKAIAWSPVPKDVTRKYPKCWYLPQEDQALAELLLRYALDLPVTATLPPGEARPFKLCVRIAQRYKSLNGTERNKLRAAIADVEPIFTHHA
jgi:aryl-alcohol dehydrogenase-like predicted oxidoreductase